VTAPSSNARAGFLIVLLAALFTYGLIHAFSIRFASGDVYPDCSSMKASADGAKLLYDSLSRTPGITVSRNYFPLEYLEESQATILLLALNGSAFAAGPQPYLDNLERLANSGNRVVAALQEWEGREKPEHAEELEKRWHVQYGFDPDEHHPHRLYIAGAPDWRVLDRDGPKILAIERDFQKGSVVLLSESRDFSNRAIVKLDRLELISTVIAPNSRVIFDEEHLCWHDRLSQTYLRKC